MRLVTSRVGNWGSVGRLAVNLNYEINRAVNIALKQFGLKAQAIARKHISSQDLAGTQWAPLSRRYINWKARRGYSLHTYVMTGTYFNNVRTFLDRNTRTVYVGVRRDAKHRAEGKVVSLAMIAKQLEEGVPGKMPPRRLWKPTLEEAMRWYYNGNRAGDILLRILRTKYI